MNKKTIASGAVAAVLATGLALAPAVTDTDVTEPSVIEEVMVEEAEESIDVINTEKDAAENEETKSEDTAVSEDVIETPDLGDTEIVKSQQPHLEAEKPIYKDYTLEIGYSFLSTSERSKTLIIDVPDVLSADIATMYVNGAEVSTTLIPTEAKFTTIPVVFEDLSNIEIKLYRMGEEIGTAYFIDKRLMTNAKVVE